MTAAQLDNGKIVGQLPATDKPEQFGFVLEKGSKLTPACRRRLTRCAPTGRWPSLQKQWLTAEGAPELS